MSFSAHRPTTGHPFPWVYRMLFRILYRILYLPLLYWTSVIYRYSWCFYCPWLSVHLRTPVQSFSQHDSSNLHWNFVLCHLGFFQSRFHQKNKNTAIYCFTLIVKIVFIDWTVCMIRCWVTQDCFAEGDRFIWFIIHVFVTNLYHKRAVLNCVVCDQQISARFYIHILAHIMNLFVLFFSLSFWLADIYMWYWVVCTHLSRAWL